MIYCRNVGCPLYHELRQPEEFKFSKYVTPIAPIMVSGMCSIQPLFEDVIYEFGDILYKVSLCLRKPGTCEKYACLHNDKQGKCERESVFVDQSLIGNELLWVCRTYSDKHVSGHMDWSRYPQGGNIDSEYAEKLNLEATKFKSYQKGHHEARELPSYVEKQHKEWELDRLRQRWTDNQAKTRRVRIRP